MDTQRIDSKTEEFATEMDISRYEIKESLDTDDIDSLITFADLTLGYIDVEYNALSHSDMMAECLNLANIAMKIYYESQGKFNDY